MTLTTIKRAEQCQETARQIAYHREKLKRFVEAHPNQDDLVKINISIYGTLEVFQIPAKVVVKALINRVGAWTRNAVQLGFTAEEIEGMMK